MKAHGFKTKKHCTQKTWTMPVAIYRKSERSWLDGTYTSA